MPSITSWVSTLFLLATAVNALPGGAPKCAINPAVITAAHGAPKAAGYKIAASATSYTPGQKVEVKLTGTSAIAGVLMYATAGAASDAAAAPNSSKKHVGKFDVANGFRAQTATICDAAGIVNDAPESTITHANPTPKGNEVTFSWTAPAADVGPITFNVAVASGSPGQPWQVLDIVTLNGAGGAAPAPGGAANPTGTNAPTATKRKCTKKTPTPATLPAAGASTTVTAGSQATSTSGPTLLPSSADQPSGVFGAFAAVILGAASLFSLA
ncbi:hypothetical protein DFS34DRAFT_19104 [Phlyctochytrium arcticum]|nr:hypothetical protein DFS34DRAFT_19104 [Phlyctochytrium arcticum]